MKYILHYLGGGVTGIPISKKKKKSEGKTLFNFEETQSILVKNTNFIICIIYGKSFCFASRGFCFFELFIITASISM